ncbi:hydrolase [Sphingomonas sp. Leaf33]|uniref:alpha/beta hydrolase n=1 Tax=Sphingomonas sp. Leaf33 TaxID=1736215 RepID=UPI0006FDDD71|nr:alpha/beta hydrolase [Sphingomonas sp. Leaf33]KQN25363.1 hydrolase [Sphingomonas sp. Leaf33]
MMLTAMLLAAAAPQVEQVTVPGPQGPLAGTLTLAGGKGPAVVIIPGSGPTDRDGNSPLGITAGSYRMLADALAAKGVSSIRIDKRGMFGSRAAVADANSATMADYAADARAWARLAAKRTGNACAWLVGHSEGGMVALQAAQAADGICGVVLVSSPGRSLGNVMRAQFRANPANAPILDAALGLLDTVEAGRTVDPATLPVPLGQMFPLGVQAYLARAIALDPAKLAATAKVPVAIVQGDADLQVSVADDARRLAAANPKATLTVVPGVNHVLKVVGSDRLANQRSYADSSLPIALGVVDAVVGAVKPGGARGAGSAK